LRSGLGEAYQKLAKLPEIILKKPFRLCGSLTNPYENNDSSDQSGREMRNCPSENLSAAIFLIFDLYQIFSSAQTNFEFFD
tara:strand:- start:48620 stop:48862 length:243 start_codon:yes stop_codon:yes gene_type:complete